MLEIFHGSTILKNLVVENKIGIIGAIYDIKTGQVKFSMYDSEIQLFNTSENQTFIHSMHQWYQDE